MIEFLIDCVWLAVQVTVGFGIWAGAGLVCVMASSGVARLFGRKS